MFSIGAGVRIILPILQGAPLALDFALPISSARTDDEQVISFSFGINY